MSTPLLPNALWNLIQPLLPSALPSPPGWQTSLARPCLSHRNSVCSPQRDPVGDAAPGILGSISHGIPLRRTNRIPVDESTVSQARSATLGAR